MRENARRQVDDADKSKDPTQWVLKNLEEIDDGIYLFIMNYYVQKHKKKPLIHARHYT